MAVIGILALQGDFAEHKEMIEHLGEQAVLVKHAGQLADVDGLIIPGGESTTIAKLTTSQAKQDDIFDAILCRAGAGMPIYGTCMGSIFLARGIEGSTQGRLALMDITVRRNAFGPQKFSREQSVTIAELGEHPFPLVFIRGPIITACGAGVQTLAKVEEGIVMARQGNLLVTAFHPELTGDQRVHRYFLDMVKNAKSSTTPFAWPTATCTASV
ncbi:MAG TPA: pyridoxal 5'-phosphate synthase glutaminase subunit PdxT [Candidatus Obscuribacterales bacterium]